MIIGFDGKRAVCNLTGLGNYSRLVLESLSAEYPSDSLIVYSPKWKDNPRLTPLGSAPNVRFSIPAKRPAVSAFWRSFSVTGQLRKDGVELFHGLSNELPLNIQQARIPSVVTIHDVIYRRLPDCYGTADRLFCDFKYGRSCRLATRIIAISERTRNDIVDIYHIDPDKIDIVYQGCDPSFRQQASAATLARVRSTYHLPDSYILQVGTVEKRKNLELTIRALSALRDRETALVVVGGDRRGYRREMQSLASAIGVADRIIWLEGVPFADLPAICQSAEVIVYPSRYEGFGIPVLEALESRRPVIAATGSCLEEAGGPSSIYVDPDDPRAMAEAIDAVLSGSADTVMMVAEGVRHAARFDPANLASDIHRVYGKALSQYHIR